MTELYDVSGTYGSTLNITSVPSGTNAWYDAYSHSTLHTKDHSIKGDMLVVEMTERDLFPLTSSMSNDNEIIKKNLVAKLVDKLMESNHIEFTKQPDPQNMSLTYRARIFAVPDTDIQLIRTALK
ncbi:hypothetical protein UFOVP84_191 [uncultured Caudovirales phage]|uniref:Uncharacterized protein n=1 Tax=uncultured Caudovirales phage TaxID=2100421 RepID=A0A6J5L2D1_9CAUD|nr:hypothetical protein UFOVP84_191 [uncultured Caudovirales phage]